MLTAFLVSTASAEVIPVGVGFMKAPKGLAAPMGLATPIGLKDLMVWRACKVFIMTNPEKDIALLWVPNSQKSAIGAILRPENPD